MTQVISYIDPGTGSMLFTVLIGAITTLFFFAQRLMIKLKFLISAGSARDDEQSETLPVVMFSDDKRYWKCFKPVCDELERRKIRASYWTASEDDPGLDTKYEYVETRCLGTLNQAFLKLNTMRADIVLSTTPGLDVYQWKRSKNVKWYVHFKHGADTTVGYRMFGQDHYDAILVSSQFMVDQIRELEAKRNLPPKDVRICGVTYLDTMRDRLEAWQAEHGKRTLPADSDDITVLFSPTWGPSGLFARYGDRALEAVINTGYKVIVRPHPQSLTSEKENIDRLVKKFPENDRLRWSFDNDYFATLCEADVMVSDFSGITFDYLLVFDKPVLYSIADYDNSVYDACWLDEPAWHHRNFHRVAVEFDDKSFPHMREIIGNAVTSVEFAEERKKFRQEAWPTAGHGAENIVDYLEERLAIIRSEEADGDEAERSA